MPLDQSFPQELLNQPSSARLAYFRSLTIGHPLLLQVYDDLRLAIRDSAPGSIILVQGPAGVGKTTLLQRVEKDFREQLLPELAEDLERLPVVRGEMFIFSADLSPSLSPRAFADLLNRYARQVTVGNAAAFARFLGLDYLMLRALRYGVNRPTLNVFVTLLHRLELSAKEFFDGKESEIELPDRREISLPPRISEARELMQAAMTDPACPSVSELSARIGYKDELNFRQANPELCKEISARNRRVRKYDHQAHLSLYDDQTLREKLTAALQDNPAPSLEQIARRLGYKSAQTLKIRCPDLYAALLERRHVYLKEWKEWLEKKLKAVLIEEPPPTLREATSRVGMKNESVVAYHFPDMAKAIADRYKEHRKKCREQAKLALEAALTEMPPPSVRQVAKSTRYGLTRLYLYFPDLCRRVAANRIEYLHQRSIARKEKRKAEIKQVVLSLNAQGTFPSRIHILQSPLGKNALRADWAREYYEELLGEITLPDKTEGPDRNGSIRWQ